MAKIRIHEIAKELGYDSKEIIEKANELGLNIKTASNAVEPDVAAGIYEYIQTKVIPEAFKKNIKQTPAKKTKAKIKEDKVQATKITTSAKQEKVEKKEMIKPKEEIKEESKEKVQESLASATLAKRRGLVIVKKKKTEEELVKKEESKNVSELSSNQERINLKTMFSNTDLDDSAKRKKKDKKPNIAVKKESAQKMDLLGNQDFAEISLDDEDEVVLPDFSVKEEEKPNNAIKKQPNFLRQAVGNSVNFAEGGIQRRSRKKPPKKVEKKENEAITSVEIPKEIRVYEFADKIGKSTSEVISKLFMLGMMTTKNDFLDEDAIEILGSEFGIEVSITNEADEFDYVKDYEAQDDEKDLITRAPVITIMGHVDHGKTSLLDFIRKSRIASGEAGGITQHVGAYMVKKNDRKITFIDTPGHEAFTAMRARGASITDIVIIVVAADDGVKPQTKEAINHAKAANVPIIIAINKMDKEGANPDMVKTQLAELEIMPVEWGGSYEFVGVSAKTGMGIEDLLEIVLLQADILELKANPKNYAKASIIESSIQKGRGAVATVIVQNGTLKVGDTVVAGVSYGKIKAMSDDQGKALKEIKPGECGVIVGLSEVAQSGEILIAVKTDKEAREYAAKRYEYNRQKELSKSTKVSIDELGAKIKEGNIKALPVILKADVQGTLEALKASLEKLKNDEIKVNIIHSGVGGITQSDIELASASENSIVLGFNIRPTGEIKERAKDKGVEIKTYNVIYNLLDDVKALLGGMMSPIISEEQLGQAEIRQVINVPKLGQIAGCMVTEGVINRGAKIRLIREGVVVFEGSVSSLKRFKDDVKEVAKGYECGVGIQGCDDMRVGDYIESYKEVEEKVSL
ncbi:translation initiation factor IF-2 [Campylobacter sp. LH-2024]|uniref:translation initiation factor IF-2 n=1 Tax=Campylobacter TaxID=194 RepID=UPI0019053ECA|nr:MULTISPECIES: translation initiation factor IF-2 [unclassified Campylobacter]MBZ7945643.1 translation initiation factor IF-2 [Campylobacter sp. RM10532]MBZ7946792.1 translation initiation factor IF-2 [Campylobacter sp. RM10536]MBZ7948458.1 translation initiation factor IF-2 [Campylobacter sp. RM9929]MBZ7950100.1 translation initiation factor IF-2 [Campylobacter sp. RM10534]MBZ7951205.1 translation initiation factor IF-2 [Campylobacter sp. W0046]MBZ7952855.1 translation initiation factor IF